MATFYRNVRTPQEYKELMDAAETLDLTLARAYAKGAWHTADGGIAWPDECEIEKVGWKYFHIPMTTDNGLEVVPCHPFDEEDAYLILTFTD